MCIILHTKPAALVGFVVFLCIFEEKNDIFFAKRCPFTIKISNFAHKK